MEDEAYNHKETQLKITALTSGGTGYHSACQEDEEDAEGIDFSGIAHGTSRHHQAEVIMVLHIGGDFFEKLVAQNQNKGAYTCFTDGRSQRHLCQEIVKVKVDESEYSEDDKVVYFTMEDGLLPTDDGWKFFH